MQIEPAPVKNMLRHNRRRPGMSKIQVVSVELDNHRGSLRYWEDTLLAFGDRSRPHYETRR